MNLLRNLRLEQVPKATVVTFVGSGGKTTALFQLARQIQTTRIAKKIILTATTHLGAWQVSNADHHVIANDSHNLSLPDSGIILVTGNIENNNRTTPLSTTALNWLREISINESIPMLIEADGSRQKPLKAHAEHEPPIPAFTDIVVHVAGLTGLGKPLNEEHLHRADIFAQRSGLALGETVTPEALIQYLTHPEGGLKNFPPQAKHVALLNQAETPEQRSTGGGMARKLLSTYDAVLVGSLQQNDLNLFEHTAGIILAGGTSSRYGQFKQLLDWKGKPFVKQVTETALQAGLEPVVVVTGFRHADVESHLQNLPIRLAHNPTYEQGQSTSIQSGLQALPKHIGAAVFLLADQPQIPTQVIRALVEAHANQRQPILAPLVLEEKRANPVLFDRITFPDLLQLTGDIGGRGIFHKHKVAYLPWHDDILIFDVDKPEDYERLKKLESDTW